MKTFSIGIIIILLFLGLTSSVFGQTQIYSGCTGNSYNYPPNTYIYKTIDGKRQLVPINRALTGEGKFVFTFSLENGEIYEGDTIKFKTQTAPIKILKDRRSTLPEENFALLNWDETPLANVKQTGDWYAIYQKADDFVLPPNSERYLLPIRTEDLPSNSRTIDAQIVPPNFFYFNNNLIAGTIANELKVKSTVQKLSGMEFDTTNLTPGLYWFTLQSTAVFEGQSPGQCAKTTPPVLIKIQKKPDPNSPPWINITITGNDCEQRVITAEMGDKDNEPDSKVPPQTLTLTWRILNNEGVEVKRIDKTLGKNPRYTEMITTEDLTPGDYTITATIKDETVTNSKKETFASKDLTLECSGAGIVYFQFDEPYNSEKRNIRFKPEKYTDPESWVAFYGRTSQCKLNEDGLYPNSEFSLFYQELKEKLMPIKRNTDKLEAIIDIMIKNSDYKLHFAGYADFRNSEDYNTDLVERRLLVVKNYIKRRAMEKQRGIKNPVVVDESRFTSERRENNADILAQTCALRACDEGRKHDRRVELIYYTTARPPKLPVYKYSTCPQNAMNMKNGEIELEGADD